MATRGKRIPDWKRKKLIQLIQEGLTPAVIEERLGISKPFISIVRKKLKAMGD